MSLKSSSILTSSRNFSPNFELLETSSLPLQITRLLKEWWQLGGYHPSIRNHSNFDATLGLFYKQQLVKRDSWTFSDSSSCCLKSLLISWRISYSCYLIFWYKKRKMRDTKLTWLNSFLTFHNNYRLKTFN